MTSATWDEATSDLPTEVVATPTDRSALKSFWFGFLGLALFPLVTLQSLHALGGWFCDYRNTPLGDLFGQSLGRSMWTFQYVVTDAMAVIQSLVAVSVVVPLLYWRGGLLVRFGLALSIGIVLWNLSTAFEGYYASTRLPIQGWHLFLMALCWFGIPLICLYTPMKTSWLRAIVMGLLAAIACCLSALVLFEPKAGWQDPRRQAMYWLGLYMIVFGTILVRRNWGSIAIVEGGSQSSIVERTSSKTLLELMVVSFVLCIALIYFVGSMSGPVILISLVGIGAGLVFVLMTSLLLKGFLAERIRFGLIFLSAFLSIGMLGAVPWILGLISFQNSFFTPSGDFTALLGGTIYSVIASMVVVLHMVVIAAYLRWMGWRTVKRSK